MEIAARDLLSAASLLYWVVNAAAGLRAIGAVPLLERLSPSEPSVWPRVSVIIPARDEADLIEAAVRSRLAEGYPNAEYILIDDRSTDATGQIIDRLAAEDARVVPVHVTELPAGWLGKLNAQQVGVARATGDFFLFSDADIHHEPGTLSRIVAHVEDRRLDHVCLLPTLLSKSLFLGAFFNVFLRLATVASRPWNIPNPRSGASAGSGLFNLVRRSALERAGGLAPLRLEICEDIALGQALKWSGARQAVLNARGFVSLWFYRSVGEAVRGMEKNGFSAFGRLSVARFLVLYVVFACLDLGWLAGLAGEPLARALALAAGALSIGTHCIVSRWLRRPLLPSVVAPIGAAIMLFAAARSMVLAIGRGGIEWRGTRYSLRELRGGMRYEIG